MWFNKKREKEGLKLVTEISGHKFYCLEAVPEHTVNRFFYFIAQSEQINTMGIPLQYFLSIADQLDAQANNPKIATIIPTLTELLRFGVSKEENKWYWMTIALVEAFILIDDEPIKDISHEHNKMKRELMQNNPEARFFFINMATSYLNQLENTFKDFNLVEYFQNLTIEPGAIENIMIQMEKESFKSEPSGNTIT